MQVTDSDAGLRARSGTQGVSLPLALAAREIAAAHKGWGAVASSPPSGLCPAPRGP